MMLYHPTTGRAIEVADDKADDWRAMGWADTKPALEPAPNQDAPEGEGEAAAAEPGTKTTTRKVTK